jgi:uncharacterized protein YndB with AHSA1/START domain
LYFLKKIKTGPFLIGEMTGDGDMTETRIAEATIWINAPTSKVWHALTDPQMIKQYLFGTEVITDWRVGGPIRYRGVWQGKSYEDKGQVVEVEPEKLLVSTFWSSLSGEPDRPEFYKTVRYTLHPENGGTQLSITQDNNESDEEAQHAAQNWKMVLEGIKKLVEN